MRKETNYILLYFIAIFLFAIYFFLQFIPNFYMTEMTRLFLLCLSCLFLYLGGRKLTKLINNNKPMKTNLYIFFLLYLILLITLTLFDSTWGRNGLIGINSNITNRINLITFKTINIFVT